MKKLNSDEIRLLEQRAALYDQMSVVRRKLITQLKIDEYLGFESYSRALDAIEDGYCANLSPSTGIAAKTLELAAEYHALLTSFNALLLETK